MPDIQFPDASPYNPNVKFGERPSAFDFVPDQFWAGIRAGTGTTDLTGWVQDGLDSLGSVGGGILYLPWGVYPVRDLDVPAGVELIGDGRRRTFLRRQATLPPDRGLLNFAGDGSAVRKLAIDGMVVTPAAYTYAELTDPMEYKLTVDTSIWIHGGASDISIEQTLIYHTGGYAIAVDSRTGDIRRVLVSDADFENNRPNLAGMPGDLTAGGWGGGIHYQGDGVSHAVNGLHVDKSRFRRGTGNQLWGHLYDFGKLHTDIKATGCHFTDIGRDGIMLGGVSGGVVSDCHFRRIGYVCTDDTAPIGTPKWVSNQWAVGLDTAGLVRGVNYTNNTFLNCLGACMDGDGYAEGTVSGNICRVSKPDEPEYAEDNVAAWPKDSEKPSASYCYGFQTSNSNGIDWAARGANITGNYFYNLGLGAIRLYSARKCSAWGNTIWHPDESLAVPILMGNIGAGENQRAQDNSIGENTVHWNPAGQNPVVFEDRNTFAFASTDKNWVAGQRMFGTGMYEFRKDADTASITGRVYSSNVGGLTSRSENYLQREDGYLRMYGGDDALFTLLDQHLIANVGAGTTGGPLFNVSLNGVGGVITTGGRTTVVLDDVMATGVLYADQFFALTYATPFLDAKANLFDANTGLMRYNAVAKKFQISTAGGAGAGPRVWVDLGAGGSGAPGGPDQSVQWNDGGVFGGSADFLFNRTSKLLLVTEAIATGTRSALPISDVMATGVLYADQFLGLTYTAPFPDAKADLFDDTTGLMRYNSAVKRFQISTAGGAGAGPRVWVDMSAAGGGPGGPDQAVQWNDDGIFGGDADLVFNRTSKILRSTVALSTGARDSLAIADIVATGVLYGDCFLSLTNTTFDDTKANLLNDNWGLLRYDRTAKNFQVSTSVSAGARVWVNTNLQPVTPGSPLQSVQFNDDGVFAGNAEFSWNKTSKMLVVVGAIATGARTSLPFDDSLATGVVAADTFLSLTDTVPDPTKSNILPATYGLIRYLSADKKFQTSNSVTGFPAVRVWNDLYTGAAPVPGAPLQSVQFNDNSAFAGSANFSWNKTSNTLVVVGAIGLGVRTALPMTDLIASGVMSVDNFSTFTDGTFDGTKANLFDGSYGLIRFDKTLKKFQISTTVTTGPNARVWVDLYTGGAVVPGGVTNSVQYKTATGTFGGDSHITWDSVARILTVEGDTNNAASIYSSYGWIQSEHGFYSPMPVSDNVVNIPNGGVTARNLISIRDDEGPALKLARTTGSGGQSADFQWRIDAMGAMVLKDSKNSLDRLTLEQNGTFSFSGGDTNFVDISSTSGFVLASTSVSAPLLRASNANDTAIQATAGGIQVKSGAQVGQALYLKAYPDPLAGLNNPPTTEFGVAATFGGLAYKSGTQYRVWNGSAWTTVDFATVGGGVTSITGTANQIAATPATGAVTLTLPQDIAPISSPTFSYLNVTNVLYVRNVAGDMANYLRLFAYANTFYIAAVSSAGAGVGSALSFRTAPAQGDEIDRLRIGPTGTVYIFPFYQDDNNSGAILQVTGSVTATTGFNALTNTAPDAIQAKGGGVWAKKLIGDMALYMLGNAASSSLNNPSGTYGGLAYKSGTEYWLWNGVAWVSINFATVGGGVTSITGRVNQITASQATGAVQLTLPQDIATTSTVTFSSVYVTESVYVGNTGGDLNTTFRLDGAGGNVYLIAEGNLASAGAGIFFRTTVPGGTTGVDRVAINPYGQFLINTTGDGNGLNTTLQVGGFISTDSGLFTKSAATAPAAVPVSTYGGLAHRFGTTWWVTNASNVWTIVDLAGGSPGGQNGAVQFNSNSAFGGDGNLLWFDVQKGLSVGSGVMHTDGRLSASGIVYIGNGGDYLCLYQHTNDLLAIQTVIDNRNISSYFSGDGGAEASNVLVLQPFRGHVLITTTVAYDSARLSVAGSGYFWSQNPAQVALNIRAASGQTANLQEWKNYGGTPLTWVAPTGITTAPSFSAVTYQTPGVSVTIGQYYAREIRFAQYTGEEPNAGLISYRTLATDALALVGAGASAAGRLIRLYDDVVVARNMAVDGTLSAAGGFGTNALRVINGTMNTQVFIGNVGPRLSLGNNTDHATSTMRLNLVLATGPGAQYGLANGHAWLFLEQAGGAINIGVHPNQTMRISAGNVLITGITAANAALTIATGYIDSGGGFYSGSPEADSVQTVGGFKGARYTFTKIASPGGSAVNEAHIFTDGAALWASVNGGTLVNLMLAGSGGGGGAVSSVSGGTGVTATPTTGAVVVSIGQNVATNANVTFNAVTTAGVHQSQATGTNATFQNTNFNFNVNGNGAVSAVGAINSSTGFNVKNNAIIYLNGTTNVEIVSNRYACYGNLADASIYSDGGITSNMNMYAKQFVVRLANGTTLPGVEDEEIEIPGGFLVRGVLRTKFRVSGGLVVNVN
jgi:hypothetical protein